MLLGIVLLHKTKLFKAEPQLFLDIGAFHVCRFVPCGDDYKVTGKENVLPLDGAIALADYALYAVADDCGAVLL